MAISSWNAGIIRPVAVAPAGPFQDGAAPGVWTLDQVAYWTQQGLWPIAGNAAPVGLFGGGRTAGGGYTNTIQSISILTTGNATDFGDLINAPQGAAACSSTIRGVFAGGYEGSPVNDSVNTISYVAINSSGNSTDFGDLSVSRNQLAGCSSSTRGVFGGGGTQVDPYTVCTIDYITISSTGNASSFGNLSQRTYQLASLSSATRGVFAGGRLTSGKTNVISYITIASPGNTTDFGDLTIAVSSLAGCSNSTRGLFSGGTNTSDSEINVIQYITIATTGNATDFGDLITSATENVAACASSTRGVIAGGNISGTKTNVIQFVTIATTGNATDFGDLVVAVDDFSGCSSAHGGL